MCGNFREMRHVFAFLLFLSLLGRAVCLVIPKSRLSRSCQSSMRMISDSYIDRRRIPFIVERLDGNISPEDNSDISELVINVFFEEEAERKIKSPSTPWKALQLAYLRNLHFGEVKSKKFVLDGENDMFIAREVIAAPSDDVNTVDLSQVFNLDSLIRTDSSSSFVRGNLLGFVDITEKRFGLPEEGEEEEEDYQPLIGYDDETVIANGSSTPVRSKGAYKRSLRAVLTNLAVLKEARFSGVGSQLVEACEKRVSSNWTRRKNEVILEVEEDNTTAQRFYEKRGYDALFADPTSRRYDTSGFFLQSVRTTKICYRKSLEKSRPSKSTNFMTKLIDSIINA